MNISSNLFLVNQKDPEKEEEDYIILNKIYGKKPNSIFQKEKYEKFKPKQKIDIEKIDSTMLTAENKVKSLLSSFLHDLKAEQKKENSINNNINKQLKKKKVKILKKKAIVQKYSSCITNNETPSQKLKKNNTVSENKSYKSDKKNNCTQSILPFNKRRNSPNSKSIIFNSHHTLKGILSNLKKKYQNNFDADSNNTLMNSNIKKSGKLSKNYSIDNNFHEKEINLISDIEKDQIYNKTNSIKKYKKTKTKSKTDIKKTIEPVINNSFYSKYGLNDIIKEKLLKLTGDIHNGILIDEILKETNNKNFEKNNNNLKYYYSYFNNNTKKNINYYSNFSDKEKSETSSPKKDFNMNNSNNLKKTENINDSQLKNDCTNEKEKFNERTQRTKSNHSLKIFPIYCINKKKDVKIQRLKDLKEKIRNTIILRPEELNLTDISDINNSQKKMISCDKEKSQNKKKIFIDNKNIESNLSNINQNINKKLNKNKFDINDEIINNKINKNSDDFLDNENKDQNQKNKTFNPLRKIKTKKEIIKQNFRVLIYKKLVYDSLDDEEVEEEYNNKYIHPDSLFIRIFDNIVSFLAFSTLIYIPYYLAATESFCKNYKNSDFAINIFVEIVYFLDFIFGFFKAYYNFEEQLITNNIAIIKKYFISWFLLDLISALPIHSYLKMKEPLCTNHNNIHQYDEIVHNLHYLLILNKILKIFKINFINHNFIKITNKLGINSTVLIQLLILLSGLHFFSCLLIFIGRNSYPNWIIESKLENKKFLDLYISSIYSLLANITTVGYGDIVCRSFNERIFQIFLLMVGGVAYSWSVSSLSNYIQKNNEKSVDFENRKKILDEISYNYPKMPNELYEKVLRYLKYKNCYEKKDKKIIFDCLPIGLKNNLVYEMYKPIIQNFIFFKNFGNSDFIVRVILAFKPILAYKNDILLNEGDFADDIFFVKKGILSVQIPINIKNPEEYIDKYLYGDIFEQKKLQNKFLNSEKQNFFEPKNNNSFINSVILKQENNQRNFLNLSEKQDLYNKMIKQEEENERKKNTRYIKIVSIRENEHFGDVLMFIDQRSPLRVKVISKKAELFFLKKMDVVKISSNYQNIWKIINKRSVFNFEQIKKSIPKIVEIYCKCKGFDIDKIDKKMTRRKSSKKIMNKKTIIPSSKLKMNTLTVKNSKRSLTEPYNKKKIYSEKYFDFKDDFSNENKNIKTHEIINSSKNNLNYSDNNNNNEEEDDSDESQKSYNINDSVNNSGTLLNRKLDNTYNRHYKYYIGSKIINESHKTLSSMIKEESENDSALTTLKSSNVIKNKLLGEVKNSTISTNNSNIKKSLIKSHFVNLKSKKLNIENINEKGEIFHNINKNVQNDNELIKKRKSNSVGELLVVEEQNSLGKDSINDEFTINEEFKIPIYENLMNRNIPKSVLLDKNIIFQIQNINDIKKSKKILNSDNSLKNNSNNIKILLDKNNNLINDNKLVNYKKIFDKENLIPDNIIKDMQIKSIYNNLHNINNKYYLNKDLQEIVKQLLEEDIINFDSNNIIKKYTSIKMNKSVNKFLTKSLSNTVNNNSNNLITNSTIKNDLKSTRVFTITSPTSPNNKKRFKQRVRSYFETRPSTYSKLEDKNENLNNSLEILKKKRKIFATNIGDFSPNKSILIKQNSNQMVSPKKQNHNISRENSVRNGFGVKDSLFSLYKNKNDITLTPYFFNKKRKSNLLSTINFNIEKNSHNINNPNEFYSFYFQSLLENEKKKTEKKRTNSMDCYSQSGENKK